MNAVYSRECLQILISCLLLHEALCHRLIHPLAFLCSPPVLFIMLFDMETTVQIWHDETYITWNHVQDPRGNSGSMEPLILYSPFCIKIELKITIWSRLKILMALLLKQIFPNCMHIFQNQINCLHIYMEELALVCKDLSVRRWIWNLIWWRTWQDAVALVCVFVCVCALCCWHWSTVMLLLHVIWPCSNTSWKQVLWLVETQERQSYLEVLTVTSTLILQRQDEERLRGQKWMAANVRYYCIRPYSYH